MDLTDWTESTHRGAHLTSPGPARDGCQTACQPSHVGNEFGNPGVYPWENAYQPREIDEPWTYAVTCALGALGIVGVAVVALVVLG